MGVLNRKFRHSWAGFRLKLAMHNLYVIVAAALLTWATLYEYVYSPKAQVRGLWKKVYKLAAELGEQRKAGEVFEPIAYAYQKKMDEIGAYINATLDYHLKDSEDKDDKEFLLDKRY